MTTLRPGTGWLAVRPDRSRPAAGNRDVPRSSNGARQGPRWWLFDFSPAQFDERGDVDVCEGSSESELPWRLAERLG